MLKGETYFVIKKTVSTLVLKYIIKLKYKGILSRKSSSVGSCRQTLCKSNNSSSIVKHFKVIE
jgi:hypothetical protein